MSSKKITLAASLFLGYLLQISINVNAQGDKIDQWGALIIENDAFGIIDKNDNDYTNGIAYKWGYETFNTFNEIDMPRWMHTLFGYTYVNKDGGRNYALDYGVAQGMYTPDDLSDPELIEDDRPYAGTLTWQGRIRNFGSNTSQNFALILGVVGPLSFAEQAQSTIHKMIDAEKPEGWDNQIRNEPVFRLEGEYINRFHSLTFSPSISGDINLYSQAGLGNLKSNVGAGLVFRIGNNLDKNYAYVNPIATRSAGLVTTDANGFSWQIHTSVYAQYVFNDITIDGNTFKDSHSVDLIHGQDLLSAGFSLRYKQIGFYFSTQQGSKQYDGQIEKSNFGSVSFVGYF